MATAVLANFKAQSVIHGNAVEYIPVALVLLLFMEMNGAETWMVHICGIILIAGRLMHYYGFHHRLFRWRRAGMNATWCALLLMVLANLWYIALGVGFLSVLAHNTRLSFSGFIRYVSPRHAFFRAYRPSRRLDF
ncbi:membrane protein [Salmonella bongori]|nr:membrane protein [Salmonella bongori]